MTEKDLNRILVSSAETLGGWAYKIVDPTKAEVMQGSGYRPFDSFGYLPLFNFVFEAKFLHGYQAFNFGMIKPHQIENLMKIKSIARASRSRRRKPRTPLITPIVLGIYEPRKFFDVYFFDIDFISRLMAEGKKSLRKTELEEFRSKKQHLAVERGFIDLNRVPEVLINDRVQ